MEENSKKENSFENLRREGLNLDNLRLVRLVISKPWKTAEGRIVRYTDGKVDNLYVFNPTEAELAMYNKLNNIDPSDPLATLDLSKEELDLTKRLHGVSGNEHVSEEVKVLNERLRNLSLIKFSINECEENEPRSLKK